MTSLITCRNCWTQNTLDCRHCPNRSNLEIEIQNAKEAERFMLDVGKIFLGIVTVLMVVSLVF